MLTQFGTFELNPWEGAWSGVGNWNVGGSERRYSELAAGIVDAPALVIVRSMWRPRSPTSSPRLSTRTLQSSCPPIAIQLCISMLARTNGSHPSSRAHC